MRANGYFRSKERTKRLKRLENQHCYFVQHKRWNDPDSFLRRLYLSGMRGAFKHQTSHVVRHAKDVSNYAGYRRLSTYDLF